MKKRTKKAAKTTNTKAAAKAKPAKPKAPAKPTKTAKQPQKASGKLSCLDAAATVLAASKQPLTTGQMIAEMAKGNLWKSPGGKTPERTLYSAILREMKGKDSRFKKTDRGHFAHA